MEKVCNCLWHFTDSMELNRHMRTIAKEAGYTLSEYGIYEHNKNRSNCKSGKYGELLCCVIPSLLFGFCSRISCNATRLVFTLFVQGNSGKSLLSRVKSCTTATVDFGYASVFHSWCHRLATSLAGHLRSLDDFP